jgi:hypothetical protein
VDVRAQVFIAGGTPPVQGGKDQKGRDGHDLRSEERAFREVSEDTGTFVKHRGQHDEEQRYGDCDKLTALARVKVPQDLFMVFFFHLRIFPEIRLLATSSAAAGFRTRTYNGNEITRSIS